MYISYVAKACLFTAVFSQLSIFTADCLRHPIQMAGVETIWELHTLSVINKLLIQKTHFVYSYTYQLLPLHSRPKTNPSADRFQYCFSCVILEVRYMPGELCGRDYLHTHMHMDNGPEVYDSLVGEVEVNVAS